MLPRELSKSDTNDLDPLATKTDTNRLDSTVEDQAVTEFFEKFVLYPGNHGSSSGFLEHLPCLFKDVNVEGRFSLRWAVRAAAYASSSAKESQNVIRQRALHCYGLALSALGTALSEPKRVADDYTLMTVVILDLFEVQ